MLYEVITRLDAAGRRFDVVLADPPTFSSSKSTGAFNVRDDYVTKPFSFSEVLARVEARNNFV